MAYHSLTVDCSLQALELFESQLYDLGAQGLEVRDHSVPMMPNVRAPEKDKAIVVAYFENEALANEACEAIKSEPGVFNASVEKIIDRDWSTEWRNQIRAVEVGQFWVGPPWKVDEAPTDKIKLVIEPKMAFGTGDHPTTQLCIRAIDEFMTAHSDATVLDVGTGTGVLAFAAHKLKALRVVGTDNDPVAIELARENAVFNNISPIELSTLPLEKVEGTFDLVVANILANTLIELATALTAKMKNTLILAGVLVHQGDEVTRAFEAQGLTALPRETMGEWVCLSFRK